MSAVTLALPEELTIKTVVEVKQQLNESLESGQPAIVESGAVSRVDGLGVQLLLAYSCAMRERNLAVDWGEPAEVLVKVSAELGVRELCFASDDRVAT